MSKATMAVEEKYWMAQSEARTLVESEMIKSDKPRLGRAVVEAKKMAVEKDNEAEQMKKVAGKQTKKPPPKKPPTKKKNYETSNFCIPTLRFKKEKVGFFEDK